MRANRDAFEAVGFVPKMAVPGLDGLAVARPRRSSARTSRSRAPRTGGVHARDAPVGRRRRRTGRQGGGHAVHALVDVGPHDRRGEGRRRRPGVVPALRPRGPRPAPSSSWRARARPATPRSWSRSTRRSRQPRAGPAPRGDDAAARDARDGDALRPPGAACGRGGSTASRRDGFSMDLAMAKGLGHAPTRRCPSTRRSCGWVLSPITWDDFGWLREAFGGPVLAKGVAHRRRRAPGGRRRRGRGDRLQPRRAPARRGAGRARRAHRRRRRPSAARSRS